MSTFPAAGEVAAGAIATKSTYAGSIATIGGYLVQSELIAFCGLVLALMGFVVNLVFKIREDRRQAEAHRLSVDGANKAAAAHAQLDRVAHVLSMRQLDGYGGIPYAPPPGKEEQPQPEPQPEQDK